MTATYQIAPHELNHFIESLRKSFRGSNLKIIVEELNETDYLLADPSRATRLLNATENVRTGNEVKSLTFDELDELEKRATL